MPNNYRIAKVSSLLKKEITIILQNDLENDLFRSNFINISRIELTGDLQFCKIYITSSAEGELRKEIIDNLNLAKNFIRHTLGQRIDMRRVPEMTFKEDTVLKKGLSVLKILEELKNKTQCQDSEFEEKNVNS